MPFWPFGTSARRATTTTTTSTTKRRRTANRARYALLLRSPRFRAYRGRADLAFKLTLAWFGLPVGPMGHESVVLAGEGGKGGFDWVGEEGRGEEEGEEGLRWLDGYGERGFGRDAERKPDPKLEAYYAAGELRWDGADEGGGLGLRGGEAVDEEDGEVVARESNTASDDGGDRQLVLRGGGLDGQLVSNVFKELHRAEATGQQPSRWSATDYFATTLYTPFGSDKTVPKRWLPLYGYQGIVWFRADSFYTFVDAVDRLLCLDNRAGIAYSLYLMDKDKQYNTRAAREAFRKDTRNNGLGIGCSGVGDYSHDHLAWIWVLDKFKGLLEDSGDGPEAYRHALFVAGPDDPVPWTWEPGPAAQVLKLALEWADVPEMNRPDVAYLRMPQNPRDVVFANQYGPWMANVCRVLAAGRIPGRPGYPAVPDAWFTIKGESEHSVLGSYGGLSFLPQLWEAIILEWEKKAGLVTLEARTSALMGDVSDRWHLHGVGCTSEYAASYIKHTDLDNPGKVVETMAGLVLDSKKIVSLELYLPGAGVSVVSDEPPNVVIPVRGTDELEPAFKPAMDLLIHYRKWLEQFPGVAPAANGLSIFPQFITLRPVYGKYSVGGLEQDFEAAALDLHLLDITTFRERMADMLCEYARNTQPFELPERYWIAITQGRRTPPQTAHSTVNHTAESKPKLLIGPDTTEAEWQLIRRMIVDQRLFVSFVDESDLPGKGKRPVTSPFGYRDIYTTPASVLYQALPQDGLEPPPARHFDWQLWNEDVTPELKTVLPWEEQPPSLTQRSALDEHPLRIAAAEPATIAAKQGQTQTGPGRPCARNTQGMQGFPGVTSIERGHALREYSYAHPLEVQMNRAIPINAPPVDALLNLQQDSVPVVSLNHHELRNLMLSRTRRCVPAILRHVTDAHTSVDCAGYKGRREHLATRHPELLDTLSAKRWDDYGWRIPPPPNGQPTQGIDGSGSDSGSDGATKRKRAPASAKGPAPKRLARNLITPTTHPY
ncbi:hypothetical protein BT67DRAFT_450874 [Trichocladium antarcticum]|uniref:Uncharacterized protein n=1 Tax=Trichocladium antarcticum TaxID=1450529 RepID=A0AAN6UHH1_9PEZI|nr:hypothetical protein BT67DRAFT_450874 [Trichocladium antarcticum]